MLPDVTVVCPGGAAAERYARTVEFVLERRRSQILTRLDGPLEGRRILFAVPLDASGINCGFYDLLARLRTHPGCLRGCVGGVLVGLAGGGVASDERRETAAFGTPVRTRHVGTSSPVVPKGKENVKRMLIDPGNILVKKNRVRAVYW